MATNTTVDSVSLSFSQALFTSLVKTLTGAGESPWMIAAVPDVEPPPDGTEPVRIKLALTGSLNGEVHLECHRVAAGIWASKLLGHTSEDFGTEQSEALLKMVTDGVKEFQAELVPEYGEFTITVSSASELPPDFTRREQITIVSDKDDRASLLMYLSPILIEAISQHLEDQNKAEIPESPIEDAPIEVITEQVPVEGPNKAKLPEASTKEAPKEVVLEQVILQDQNKAKIQESSMQGASKQVINEQVNLDLVMDVELNVTLRFGQRRLALREVLELTTGSVIELDRQVEEPVELLLEGKIIARGEAVVIDGNYGLRVTEVIPANFSPVIH
ncbi:MAG: flagellar motor switch protein FliN [Terracidiphilus sp.]|jgi:flagellar motor switch protein FliN